MGFIAALIAGTYGLALYVLFLFDPWVEQVLLPKHGRALTFVGLVAPLLLGWPLVDGYASPATLRGAAERYRGEVELRFGLASGRLTVKRPRSILVHRVAWHFHSSIVRVQLPTSWRGALFASSTGTYLSAAIWPDEERLVAVLRAGLGIDRAVSLAVVDGMATLIVQGGATPPDPELLSRALGDFLCGPMPAAETLHDVAAWVRARLTEAWPQARRTRLGRLRASLPRPAEALERRLPAPVAIQRAGRNPLWRLADTPRLWFFCISVSTMVVLCCLEDPTSLVVWGPVCAVVTAAALALLGVAAWGARETRPPEGLSGEAMAASWYLAGWDGCAWTHKQPGLVVRRRFPGLPSSQAELTTTWKGALLHSASNVDWIFPLPAARPSEGERAVLDVLRSLRSERPDDVIVVLQGRVVCLADRWEVAPVRLQELATALNRLAEEQKESEIGPPPAELVGLCRERMDAIDREGRSAFVRYYVMRRRWRAQARRLRDRHASSGRYARAGEAS